MEKMTKTYSVKIEILIPAESFDDVFKIMATGSAEPDSVTITEWEESAK